MPKEPWQKQAQLHFHYFYEAREEFVSTDNRFDEWIMVAPEAGRFEYELSKEKGEASFGDVVCVAPKGLFRRHIVSDSMTYHVLQWRLLSRAEDTLTAAWTPGKWVVGDTARLMNDFAILRRIHYKLDSFSVRRREAVAQDILHLLWETRNVLPQSTDPLMQRAASTLRDRAGDMISMQEVSSELGLGPVQFTRRFRATHSVSPIEFLTQQRLEAAQKMLIDTDATIDEIAIHCGWSHGSYLSRVFTQRFGITPGEFRKLRRV